MKQLTPGLMSAQTGEGAVPFISLKAGKTRLSWEKIHSGAEENYYHAMALTGGGVLVRARITPPENGRQLYCQRVSEPGSSESYGNWVDLNVHNVVVLAMAAAGEEVNLFYILANRRIERLVSHDGGLSWTGPELIDYSPTTAINGISASPAPGDRLGLFFADQDTLYAKLFDGSDWQARVAWEGEAQTLSGVSAWWQDDWALVVTGQNVNADYRLWRLVYGDGSQLEAGSWSSLEVLAGAPQGEGFAFRHASLSHAGGWHCFYVESYSGIDGYERVYYTRAPGEAFMGLGWVQAKIFGENSPYGLAQAAGEGYLWAGSSREVWRAKLDTEWIELESSLTELKTRHSAIESRVSFTLDNSGENWLSSLAELEPGGKLSLELGYVTASNNETVSVGEFDVSLVELSGGGGRAECRVAGNGGWERLRQWQAPYQHRWNREPGQHSAGMISGICWAGWGLV